MWEGQAYSLVLFFTLSCPLKLTAIPQDVFDLAYPESEILESFSGTRTDTCKHEKKRNVTGSYTDQTTFQTLGMGSNSQV